MQNVCPLHLHRHNVVMKYEVIPPDRLVISEGTSAGEEVCVSVCVCARVKQINYFPRGLLLEYVIFQNVLLEATTCLYC